MDDTHWANHSQLLFHSKNDSWFDTLDGAWVAIRTVEGIDPAGDWVLDWSVDVLRTITPSPKNPRFQEREGVYAWDVPKFMEDAAEIEYDKNEVTILQRPDRIQIFPECVAAYGWQALIPPWRADAAMWLCVYPQTPIRIEFIVVRDPSPDRPCVFKRHLSYPSYEHQWRGPRDSPIYRQSFTEPERIGDSRIELDPRMAWLTVQYFESNQKDGDPVIITREQYVAGTCAIPPHRFYVLQAFDAAGDPLHQVSLFTSYINN